MGKNNEVNTEVTTPSKVSTPKYTRIKNVESRPLEINFNDEEGVQRIAPNAIDFISEKRLESDKNALVQFNTYVESRKLRVLATGVNK